MKKESLFSVIIPVYNRQACVRQAIDSIVAQDYSRWELILVDDGSTDQTEMICRKYAEEDSRISYFRKENSGVSSARNLGLTKVSGDYVLFLDSDDTFMEKCLSVLNCWIGAQEDALDICCFGIQSGSAEWKSTEKSLPQIVKQAEIRNCYLPTHINIYPQNKNFLLNYIWNKCYRAAFIKENDLCFDESRQTWEDGLFVVNCLEHANTILLISDVLHKGCIDPTIEHLSGRFYDSQVFLYLQDETNYKNRFANKYNFLSEHYCHANLSVLNMLFSAAFAKYGRKAGEILELAVQSPIVTHWVKGVAPNNKFERYLRTCVLHKQYHRVICFYQLHSIKKSIINLIRR